MGFNSSIYPKGMNQDNSGLMSAFIRPIKSLAELAYGENWSRPVTQFKIKVRSRDTIGTDVGDFHQVFESELDFQGFSNAQPGWGFPEFIPYPCSNECTSYDGRTGLDIEISGSQIVKKATLAYEERLNIPQESPVFSSSFGEESHCWKLIIAVKDGKISCHLSPVFCSFEARLGENYGRNIEALTIKVVDPFSKSVLISRTLTGGFIFNLNGANAGWVAFYDFNARSTDLNALIFHCSISWDPLVQSRSTQDGQIRVQLSQTSMQLQSTRVTAEINQEKFLKVTAELDDNTSASEQRNLAIRARMIRLQDQLDTSQSLLSQNRTSADRVSVAEERAKFLIEELRNMRHEQKQIDISRIKISKLKQNLVRVRLSLESPILFAEPASLDDLVRVLETDLGFQKQINVDLEVRLAQNISELNFVNNCVKDQSLFASFTEPGETFGLEDGDLLMNSIEAAFTELVVAEDVIEEAKSRISVMNTGTSKRERLNLVADIAIVFCGCDVARASLHEQAMFENENSWGQTNNGDSGYPPELFEALNGLDNCITEMTRLRSVLEAEPFMMVEVAANVEEHLEFAEHEHVYGNISGQITSHELPFMPSSGFEPQYTEISDFQSFSESHQTNFGNPVYPPNNLENNGQVFSNNAQADPILREKIDLILGILSTKSGSDRESIPTSFFADLEKWEHIPKLIHESDPNSLNLCPQETSAPSFISNLIHAVLKYSFLLFLVFGGYTILNTGCSESPFYAETNMQMFCGIVGPAFGEFRAHWHDSAVVFGEVGGPLVEEFVDRVHVGVGNGRTYCAKWVAGLTTAIRDSLKSGAEEITEDLEAESDGKNGSQSQIEPESLERSTYQSMDTYVELDSITNESSHADSMLVNLNDSSPGIDVSNGGAQISEGLDLSNIAANPHIEVDGVGISDIQEIIDSEDINLSRTGSILNDYVPVDSTTSPNLKDAGAEIPPIEQIYDLREKVPAEIIAIHYLKDAGVEIPVIEQIYDLRENVPARIIESPNPNDAGAEIPFNDTQENVSAEIIAIPYLKDAGAEIPEIEKVYDTQENVPAGIKSSPYTSDDEVKLFADALIMIVPGDDVATMSRFSAGSNAEEDVSVELTGATSTYPYDTADIHHILNPEVIALSDRPAVPDEKIEIDSLPNSLAAHHFEDEETNAEKVQLEDGIISNSPETPVPNRRSADDNIGSFEGSGMHENRATNPILSDNVSFY